MRCPTYERIYVLGLEALFSDVVFVVDVDGDEDEDEDESLEPDEDEAGVLFSDGVEASDLSDFPDFSDLSDLPAPSLFAAFSPEALSAFSAATCSFFA